MTSTKKTGKRTQPRGPGATWACHDGMMTFTLPDRGTRVDRADRYDHPMTICAIIDLAVKLTPYERRSLISILSEFEMRSMYPLDLEGRSKERP